MKCDYYGSKNSKENTSCIKCGAPLGEPFDLFIKSVKEGGEIMRGETPPSRTFLFSESNDAPKYCQHCGRVMVFKEEIESYDNQTKEPKKLLHVYCPKRKDIFGFYNYNSHDEYYYRYDILLKKYAWEQESTWDI